MANEISHRHSATGENLYFTIRNTAHLMWNTAGTPNFESLSVEHWGDYDVALSEPEASAYFYLGTFPAIVGNMVAGWYWVDIFKRIGGSPATSDTLVASYFGYWNGTTFQWWDTNVRQLLNQTAQQPLTAQQTRDAMRLGPSGTFQKGGIPETDGTDGVTIKGWSGNIVSLLGVESSVTLVAAGIGVDDWEEGDPTVVSKVDAIEQSLRFRFGVKIGGTLTPSSVTGNYPCTDYNDSEPVCSTGTYAFWYKADSGFWYLTAAGDIGGNPDNGWYGADPQNMTPMGSLGGQVCAGTPSVQGLAPQLSGVAKESSVASLPSASANAAAVAASTPAAGFFTNSLAGIGLTEEQAEQLSLLAATLCGTAGKVVLDLSAKTFTVYDADNAQILYRQSFETTSTTQTFLAQT
jgi:hypothetical protein